MEFADELYLGGSIRDEKSVISMLKAGQKPSGVFCVCKNINKRFMYEILSAGELLKERNKGKYKIYGLAAGKREAFEVLRCMLEDENE